MNKALSGNKQEIIYTKQLNIKDKFWENLSFDKNTTYAIHIISKKYGKINEAKIHPKADIILAKGNVPIDFIDGCKQHAIDFIPRVDHPLDAFGCSLCACAQNCNEQQSER